MNSVFLSNYQKQVFVGLLLGDGSLRNPNAHKRVTGNFHFECSYKLIKRKIKLMEIG
jgi:hypothetical protein